MIRRICTAALLLSIAGLPQISSAKGCLKGAAVGGHGVLGAAAVCAIGRHRAAKKEQQQEKTSDVAPAK